MNEQIASGLRVFLTEEIIDKGVDDMALFNKKAIRSKDGLTALVKVDQLQAYLRERGVIVTVVEIASTLKALGAVARGNTQIGDRQVRPYEVFLSILGVESTIKRGEPSQIQGGIGYPQQRRK